MKAARHGNVQRRTAFDTMCSGLDTIFHANAVVATAKQVTMTSKSGLEVALSDLEKLIPSAGKLGEDVLGLQTQLSVLRVDARERGLCAKIGISL